MKIKDFLPELPKILEQQTKLAQLTNNLQLMKHSTDPMETYRSPTVGLETVYGAWLRQQMAYRQQLMFDLENIARSCEEVRGPVQHIIAEVFRKGIHWRPSFVVRCEACKFEYPEYVSECAKCGSKEGLTEPDHKQKVLLDSFIQDANVWDQSLLDVLKSAWWDINVLDDLFLYIVKEYIEGENNSVRSKPIEIRRLAPGLVEFDLDEQGLPKNSHFLCYIHRDTQTKTEAGECDECGRALVPVMYKLYHRGRIIYLLDKEVIHVSKLSPSETYGHSGLLTIMYKVLSILGMDMCYDEQTEVLTKKGWKYFRSVERDDEFLTIAPSGEVQYQGANYFFRSFYTGLMYQLKELSVDLLVTPNHNMYISSLENNEFTLVEAQHIFGKPYRVLCANNMWDGKTINDFDTIIVNDKVQNDSWVQYSGNVYCVEVPNHTVLVRRNGKSVVCGQSIYRYFYERRMPACYDDQTEVLTKNGWMYFQNVNENDEFLTIDETNSLVYEHPIRLYEYDYDGDMYSVKNRFIDLVVTPNHHMLVKKKGGNFFIANADEVKGKKLYHQRGGVEWCGEYVEKFFIPEAIFTNDYFDNKYINENFVIPTDKKVAYLSPLEVDMNSWLKFMGYYLSKGSVGKYYTTISMSQKISHKREIILKDLCELPFIWWADKNGFHCNDIRLFNYLTQFGHSCDRFVPRELLNLNKEQLKLLFDAWVLGDTCCTSSHKLRDGLIEIAIKLGMSVSYRTVEYSDVNHMYYLEFSKKVLTAAVNTQHIDDAWIDYVGKIYCVEIPHGKLLVRRGGKCVWSGNSMLMVFTDDPESLRRERENIASKMRTDPNYIPMIAVSTKNNRGRVDHVRLFHTLQEMDYLPVREEIRQRIAALWGVTPVWQGASEAMGGISATTQQLVVMSRVVEGDQRILKEKVFPQILDAFGITDWILDIPQPEEKAEATRIAHAQQRISAANMLVQMGFDVKIKVGDVIGLDDIDFVVSGEAINPMKQQMAMMGGSGMPGQLPQEFPAQEEMNTRALPVLPQNMNGNTVMEKSMTIVKQLQDAGFIAPDIREVAADLSYVIFHTPSGICKADFIDGNLVGVQPFEMKAMNPNTLHSHLPDHPERHDVNMPHNTLAKKNRFESIDDVDESEIGVV